MVAHSHKELRRENGLNDKAGRECFDADLHHELDACVDDKTRSKRNQIASRKRQGDKCASKCLFHVDADAFCRCSAHLSTPTRLIDLLCLY